jgi:lysozyme family protein
VARTNLGVTLATARRLGIDVDADGDTDITDIMLLKPEHAAKVYRHSYWNTVRGNDLPSGVDYVVFDFAVNSGPSRSMKFLQRALGVRVDGVIGPITLDAAYEGEPAALVKKLCFARLAWLRNLRTWKTFGKGWGRRVDGVRVLGVEMALNPQPKDARKPVSESPASEKPEHPSVSPVGWLVIAATIAATLGGVYFLLKSLII